MPRAKSTNASQSQNEAQRLLLERDVTCARLASAGKVSRPAALKYLTGESVPRTDVRRRIERKWPEVKIELWDRRPSLAEATKGAAPSQPTPPVTNLEAPGAARLAATEYLQRVRRLRHQAEVNGVAGDLARLLDLERKAIVDFGRFSGELTSADESKLTQSRSWVAIRESIAKALEPHPAALKDVWHVLGELGAA